MKVAVIVAAAGRGERFDPHVAKVWQLLGGHTLVERAWCSFCPDTLAEQGQACTVDWIGIAVDPAHVTEAQQYVGICPVTLQIVAGGDTRSESVYRVLTEVPKEFDIIAVHDAARPFWPVETWDELVQTARTAGGAILAARVQDTMKRIEGDQLSTVDRSHLWAAQTPQVFRAKLLRDAYERAVDGGIDATDDAELVQRIGGSVKIVPSTSRNFKITTRLDWELADALVAGEMMAGQLRCGHGYDAHRLGGDGPLMLGGVRLSDSGGLIGHSDGDVLLHAICDALLGAIAQGDIGQHFPPTDPQYKGCDSRDLLRATWKILADHDYSPVQVDATVLAESPRLAPYISEMRACIAADLGLDVGVVSVKATTTEGMGFVGRGEGVAAHAVALVRHRPRDVS